MTTETAIKEKHASPKLQSLRSIIDFDNTVVLGLRQLLYHIKTLYLFTASDIKSIVLPQTLFAAACALSPAPLTPKGPYKS
ncbi:hypothetical protein PRZ48_009064 [Zasmidium cellare]|uniref:Uncharacterized protein n=1 Tax=Zasmidium cellare TaxID=395010 RepID=A0ABR0EH94_ZASCE|nr:hypothetical protein PRZ48_009064 [Zasmidium cellare]